MARIKKIKVRSFVKFQTVVGAIIGLCCGILYSIDGLIIDSLVSIGWLFSNETPGLSFGTVLAFGALVGRPIIFAFFGFLLGFIEALLYNLYAKWFGGLELNLE